MVWPLDRSRFLAGFDCPWKRLLRFHAFGTGIERTTLEAPLSTGIAIHSALEQILKTGVSDRAGASSLLGPTLAGYVEKIKDQNFENPEIEPRIQLAIVEALAHAYTRITIPWLNDNFKIESVEEGKAVELPGGIIWRSREDFLARSKTSGALSIHDFKSSAYWSDNQADDWSDSLQQMLNAYVASINYKEPVESYYIHILVKGTKKSPSYLTHPSYRPANPPMVTEDILPYWTPKGGYARVFAPEIPLSIPEWVWRMDPAYCAKAVPVVGPFPVNFKKIERFLASLPLHEKDWQEKLDQLSDWENWASPNFQAKADALFPRTFNCIEYGRKCQFYSLCHQQPGWEKPLQTGYATRVPHHQIGEDE